MIIRRAACIWLLSLILAALVEWTFLTVEFLNCDKNMTGLGCSFGLVFCIGKYSAVQQSRIDQKIKTQTKVGVLQRWHFGCCIVDLGEKAL